MLKKIAKNGKVFGILAIVVAGLSFIIPVFGIFLACFVGTPLVVLSLKDGLILGYVAGGLNVINIAFLSPSLAIASAGAGTSGVYFFYLACVVIGPVGLYFLNKKV
tara:strand:+ start:1183 stop:1500 length:318 start_codon:yes stop_codon:yes gene_type:complete